jgi:hypothetical protein
MRTAQRKKVVAFRTFLRTVLHEYCHHLDYALLKFEDSFHTEVFTNENPSYSINWFLAQGKRLGYKNVLSLMYRIKTIISEELSPFSTPGIFFHGID